MSTTGINLDVLKPGTDIKTIGGILALAIVYFIAAKAGFLFPFEGLLPALFLPAIGTSIAVMMIFGVHLWPGVVLGALAITISNQYSPILTVLITISNTIEPLVVAYTLVHIVRFNMRFEETRDVLVFILMAMFVGPIIGAILADISFLVSPEGHGILSIERWWQWWATHAISIMTVTPVLLTWYATEKTEGFTVPRFIELIIAGGTVIIASLLIFIQIPGLNFNNQPLGHVLFPFLLWIALRFSPREVATLGLITSIIAITGTINHTGPFSRPDLNQNIGLLLTFVLSVVSMVMLISTVLTQRRKAQEVLQGSHEILEQRVAERTISLQESNAKLMQEIKERRKIEADLELARDQAIQALEIKSQILANVSHDVRTPLSVIILRTQILQRYSNIDESQRKNLTSVLVHAKELQGFFDNFLTEASSQAGKFELNYKAFRPVDLLRQISSNVETLSQQKGLCYEATLDENLPETLYGDFDRLKQIAHNLIGNAIKFTNEGSVNVRLHCVDETHWGITVSDTGRGIPPKAQVNIFDPFWQVDGSPTRTANRGVGLGLSIVKQLSGLMNGSVHLVASSEKGSEFMVRLPVILEPVEDTTEEIERSLI